MSQFIKMVTYQQALARFKKANPHYTACEAVQEMKLLDWKCDTFKPNRTKRQSRRKSRRYIGGALSDVDVEPTNETESIGDRIIDETDVINARARLEEIQRTLRKWKTPKKFGGVEVERIDSFASSRGTSIDNTNYQQLLGDYQQIYVPIWKDLHQSLIESLNQFNEAMQKPLTESNYQNLLRLSDAIQGDFGAKLLILSGQLDDVIKKFGVMRHTNTGGIDAFADYRQAVSDVLDAIRDLTLQVQGTSRVADTDAFRESVPQPPIDIPISIPVTPAPPITDISRDAPDVFPTPSNIISEEAAGPAWSKDTKRPTIHGTNRKTRGAVNTMMNQWEANIAARPEDAKKELNDVEKTGEAFEKIAKWMDDKCDSQLKEMEEKLEKLKQTHESTIIQLTEELTEKSAPWGRQNLIDIGLRWLEEKDKWVPKADLDKMKAVTPVSLKREMYYQYFLGLGHRMVKALVLLASSLRYELRDLNAPAQKAFWDKWNSIITMQSDNNFPKSVQEIVNAFKELLPDQATPNTGGIAEMLAQLPPDNLKRARAARDLLLLTEFRVEETKIETDLKDAQLHFEKSMYRLLAIAKKTRGKEIEAIPTDDQVLKQFAPAESILNLPEVKAARQLKTEQLTAEMTDNKERLTLMEHLVGSIPRLMWVLYVDTDEFAVEVEQTNTVSGVQQLFDQQRGPAEREGASETERFFNFKPIMGGKQLSRSRQAAVDKELVTKSLKFHRQKKSINQ